MLFGQARRPDTTTLISGSQVRALVRPPSSPPKLTVEDLPAERPIFGRFFAIGEGGSCVSAHRSRLLGTFWGACLRGEKSRSRRQLRSRRHGARVQNHLPKFGETFWQSRAKPLSGGRFGGESR